MKHKDHKDHGWRRGWNMGKGYDYQYCATKGCACAHECCRKERPKKAR